MTEQAGSLARENQYREILVRVYPWPQGGQVSVSARLHRGGRLLWDRRLGVFGLAPAAASVVADSAGVLRAAAASLEAAADRMDRL